MKYLFCFIFIFTSLFANIDPLKKAAQALSEGNYKVALEFVEDAKKVDKKNPEVYRMKALLHEALNQHEKALTSWKKCLKFSKNEYVSSEAKVHIQNLEGNH